MHPDNTKDTFIAVSRDELLAGSSKLGFDLFSVDLDKEDLEPRLICRRGTSATAVADILKERVFAKLLIRKQDLQSFYDHMEGALSAIIDNPRLASAKKSKLIYTCATKVMQDIYNDPRSGDNLARTRQMSDTIIGYTLSDPASIPSLLSLSSHDYYTFTHCVNVAVFAVGLWQFIGLGSEEELREFALGCILHDLGKSAITDAILNKPGRLTTEEFATIKTHPGKGHALMADSLSATALDIILHHHERYDGSGYPEGLQGDEISDNAKVAIIADVYDALTTNRPYGEARDPFAALLLMKEKMVGHFEQKKFIAFIKFLSNTRNG